MGKFVEAIQAFDLAIKYKPDDAEAYYNKGNALYKLGKFSEAIQSYDLAIKYQPDLKQAHENKALALKKLNGD